MEVIYKFELILCDCQFVIMPIGSRILCVKEQNGVMCLWAICDCDAEYEQRNVRIYGTGHQHDRIEGNYVGTCLSGPFVWHVFID